MLDFVFTLVQYVALLTDSVDFIMGLNPAKGGAGQSLGRFLGRLLSRQRMDT